MKSLLLLVFITSLCGCSSLINSTAMANKVQNALTNILPPDYNGDVEVAEINPYFDIGFKATGVHKTAEGKWTWAGIEYGRHDMWHTSGTIKLTPKVVN